MVKIDINSELDPKCLNGQQEAFAITNRGELIPCCWLDTGLSRDDLDYEALALASNINDYDSIDEILLQPEWIEFRKNLRNGKGFKFCHLQCKKRDKPQHKREMWIDEDGNVKQSKET